LPDDYFNAYVERILDVTQANEQRVARKYVVPDPMAVIVVGDRATIEESIRALDAGPVRHSCNRPAERRVQIDSPGRSNSPEGEL